MKCAKLGSELLVFQGRDILQNTVDLVQNNLNLEVIYGDTDSIMIHTGLEDLQIVKSIAVKVIKEVNKKYKLLEIDLDGIFKRMLLLKKKKYAAVKMEANGDGSSREVIEQKGLDIVRRDWSVISKDIGNFCLEQILSGGTCEDVVQIIHTELRKLQDEMRKGQVDLDKYVITKSLTKAPEAYPDAKNQPHVQVALRLKQAGHRIGCSVGDTVPYIICIEQGSGSTLGIAERARHPDELKQDPGNWMVDIDYYLSQQIHPVVSRLCAPIEGTDAKHLADCLGLDASKFQTRTSASLLQKDEALVSASAILDDDDRTIQELGISFPIEKSSTARCPELTKDADSDELKSASSLLPEDYLQCPKCRNTDNFQGLSAAMLANQLKQRVDEFIKRYYEGWMKCDDELCGLTTRTINLRVLGDSERGTICPNHPRCSGSLARQYTEVDLYKQLTHLCRILDANRALEKIPEMGARLEAEKRLAALKRTVDMALRTVEHIRDLCSYRWQEDVVIKEAYPLQWISSSVLTNDEDKNFDRHNDYLPTYGSSVELCDEVSIGSFSSTSTTIDEHLEKEDANDIEYGSIEDKKSNLLEDEMPVKMEKYLVHCDPMEDHGLKGNFVPMENLDSASSLEEEREEKEEIISGGIIDYLDHMEMTMEMDCSLQEKAREREEEPLRNIFKKSVQICMLSIEEPTIVEATDVINLERGQSSFGMVECEKFQPCQGGGGGLVVNEEVVRAKAHRFI
ncbi:hypothetical protein L7F22_000911 [Adiantum nelumboides]|nr:hypothetical protein [Adiantum nelumboides]